MGIITFQYLHLHLGHPIVTAEYNRMHDLPIYWTCMAWVLFVWRPTSSEIIYYLDKMLHSAICEAELWLSFLSTRIIYPNVKRASSALEFRVHDWSHNLWCRFRTQQTLNMMRVGVTQIPFLPNRDGVAAVRWWRVKCFLGVSKTMSCFQMSVVASFPIITPLDDAFAPVLLGQW